MKKLASLILTLAMLVSTAAGAHEPYEAARQRAVELRARSGGDAEVALTDAILEIARHWLDTAWGLGLPQSQTPGEGKINCGMFVGTVLVHAGFAVNHKKLQRQPSELIIKTFADGGDVRRFRNRSMHDFVTGVRAMGDGLYIIGLDFHVGFLRVRGDEVRFIHASYVTHTVVDEDATTAAPIVSSKYRVVGKLLTRRTMRAWRSGSPIRVIGNW